MPPSVEFEDSKPAEDLRFKSRKLLGEYKTPGVFGYLERMKIVSSEKQAYYLVMFFVALCLLGTVFLAYKTFIQFRGGSERVDLVEKYKINSSSVLPDSQIPDPDQNR